MMRQVGVALTTRLLLIARGLILLPVLTRNVSVGDFGLLALLLAAVAMVTPLVGLGLDNSVLRFWPGRRRSELPDHYYSVLLFVATVSFLAAGFLGFVVTAASGVLRAADGVPLLAAAALLIPAGLIERFTLLYLRATLQVGLYSALEIAEAYLSLALAAIFVLSGGGVLGVILATLVVQFLIAFVALSIAAMQIGLRWPTFGVLRGYLAFGLPLVPSALFIWVLNASDRFILAAARGRDSVAIYSVAYQWAVYATILFSAIFLIVVPATSELWQQGRRSEALSLLDRATHYGLLLSIPVVAGLAALGEPLLLLFTTPDYASGALLIPIVALGYLALMVGSMGETIVNLEQRNRPIPLLYLAAASLNVVATIALAGVLGALGAAIATLVSFAALAAMQLWLAARRTVLRIDRGPMVRALVAALFMAVVLWLIRPSGAVQLALAVVVGASLYLGMLWILGGVGRAELREVARIFGGLPSRDQAQ